MTSTALAIATPPSKHELATIDQEAKLIARSSLIPAALRNKPDEIVTIALMGRQLGLTMVDACLYIPIVNGRPFVMTAALGSMLNVRGYQWMFEETSAVSCTVIGRHPNDPRDWPLRRLTFTMKEAESAGLTKNPAYKSAPADMLRHRTLGKWVRANCPEILTGLAGIGAGMMEVDGDVTVPPPPSDDDIVVAELVDDADAPRVDEWPAKWAEVCKAGRVDRATSCALLSYAAARPVGSSVEVTDAAERDAAVRALALYGQGELVLVDGRIVEKEAE